MRSTLIKSVTLIILAMMTGCVGREKMVRVGGDDAALTGFITPVKETFEAENGIPLVMVNGGTGSELVELLKGDVDALVSVVPVEELAKEASLANFPVEKDALRTVEIGKNKTVIFLNKGIKVKNLSKKQLKEIFTGKITNWKRVNGPNRRIVVVWNPSAATENEPFIHSVLLGEPVVATYHSAVNDEDVRKKVMETPGAIGIGPYGLIAPVVRVPKSPSVSSTVVFITRGNPSPQVQKLIDLIKDVAFIP